MDRENNTLLGLMEADRAAILSELNQNRAPQAAQAVLERALDRALMRLGESLSDEDSRRAAQLIGRTLKGALPLMDCVGEARRWDRAAGPQASPKLRPLALGLLLAAAVLELAVLLGLMLAGGRLSGPIVALEALLPALMALGMAFWAGLTTGKPEKRAESPDTREEFLIDADRTWNHLRGMLLIADDALARVRADAEAQRQADAAAHAALSRGETELFSNLLESAYALNGEEGRELIESMRFYLHGQGVETVDYAPGLESRFEFLPADRPGTLRPALTQGDRTLKKGLAAR